MVHSKQTVSFHKTKELIFQRSRLCNLQEPTVTNNMEHLNTFRLLGVILWSTLLMGFPVNYTISIACQRLFLIGQLKKQRLPLEEHRTVFQASVVS
jgi:hypothetical protein